MEQPCTLVTIISIHVNGGEADGASSDWHCFLVSAREQIDLINALVIDIVKPLIYYY